MAELVKAGNLIARGRLKHQYPHSWRSKKPVIFRNTPQWFIAMDKAFQSNPHPEEARSAVSDPHPEEARRAVSKHAGRCWRQDLPSGSASFETAGCASLLRMLDIETCTNRTPGSANLSLRER